jgi:predicted nuclease of predicted toxin-antitoxin system
MLHLASDADVPRAIVLGLRRREPTIDVVRVQEAGLRTAKEPVILEWAAQEGRILFTRDHDTMIAYAYDRVKTGQSMPGLLVFDDRLTIGEVIEELLLVAICLTEDDMKDRVVFLPI